MTATFPSFFLLSVALWWRCREGQGEARLCLARPSRDAVTWISAPCCVHYECALVGSRSRQLQQKNVNGEFCGVFCVQMWLVLHVLGRLPHTNTSRAALRPGTATVVKRSAGLDLWWLLGPRVSALRGRRGRSHCVLEWLRQCCRFLRDLSLGSKSVPHSRHQPSPV